MSMPPFERPLWDQVAGGRDDPEISAAVAPAAL